MSDSSNDKIPSSLNETLSRIFADYYSHTEIDTTFLSAGAPEPIPEGNKAVKIQAWIKSINQRSLNPFGILGVVLKDFFELEPQKNKDYDYKLTKLQTGQNEILRVLLKEGLSYSKGKVSVASLLSPATRNLEDYVKQEGLSAIELEIARTLNSLDDDPMRSVHHACSVLEATCKAYLSRSTCEYKESDTLGDLWRKVVSHLGIDPKELDSDGKKKIASGLYNIVEGTKFLRNNNSAAHGKSEDSLKNIKIKPRHARLVIHAVHTLAYYILECSSTPIPPHGGTTS